jgi:hypothetical protein
VVDGLLQSTVHIKLGMFSLAWLGIPLLVVGSCFLYFFVDKLLPDRKGTVEQLGAAHEYSVDVFVEEGGVLCQKSVEEAGLCNLSYGYLVEIQRGGRILLAVAPDTQLLPLNVLVFVVAVSYVRWRG